MSKVPEVIKFAATFYKAQTTVDGGWRIYLDLGAHHGEVVAKLAQASDKVLQCAVVPDDSSPRGQFRDYEG